MTQRAWFVSRLLICMWGSADPIIICFPGCLKQVTQTTRFVLRLLICMRVAWLRASPADQLGQCQQSRGSATWGSTSEGSYRMSDPSEGSISEESIAAFNWKNT